MAKNEAKTYKIEVEVDEDNLAGYYAFLGTAKENDVRVIRSREYVPRPDLKGRTPRHLTGGSSSEL